jgi:hypothetical protein
MAKRICYGDPPGYLHPPLTHLGNCQSSQNRVKQWFWKNRLGDMDRILHADKSLIAVNLNGRALNESDQLIPVGLLLETLNRIKCRVPDLNAQEAAWIKDQIDGGERPHVLVLSNFSDSKMMRFLDEIDLYAEVCDAHIPEGQRIFIKPHPGTSSNFIDILSSRLSAWDVRLLPSPFRNYPLEFFPDILASCRVLSVSSSSVLLAHLFGTHVTHALTDALIMKYMHPHCSVQFCKANQQLQQFMSSMAHSG